MWKIRIDEMGTNFGHGIHVGIGVDPTRIDMGFNSGGSGYVYVPVRSTTRVSVTTTHHPLSPLEEPGMRGGCGVVPARFHVQHLCRVQPRAPHFLQTAKRGEREVGGLGSEKYSPGNENAQ